MQTKTCRTCQESKPLERYWKTKAYKSGRFPDCSRCMSVKRSRSKGAGKHYAQLHRDCYGDC